MKQEVTKEEILARIAKIDSMFESANSWGSWMISCANEREGLVEKLKRDFQVEIGHKYLARTSSGGRVS